MFFSEVLEKTARELAGTTCLELNEPAPQKRDLLQPHVRYPTDRSGPDQRSGGHLHIAGG